MDYAFNGNTKIISLSNGTILNVRDMYSRWKEWVIQAGSGFLPAFHTIGGDPVNEAEGIYITSYFFLINGWRIKPAEVDHTLKVVGGVLLTIEGTEPFIPTSGNYKVLVSYSQPIKSETIATTGSTINPAIIAEAVWSYTSGLIVKKMLYNKVTKNNDIITIYNDDGTTIWKQFNLAQGGRVEV